MPIIWIPAKTRDEMIGLCMQVNEAETPELRQRAIDRLDGFRMAVNIAYPDEYGWMLMECDYAAMEKYPEEEAMTCGVLHRAAWERA